jgi:hypothetical protein
MCYSGLSGKHHLKGECVMSIRRRCAWLLSVGAVGVLILGAPTAKSASSLTRVSGVSPFANCTVQPLPGEPNYLNAEVEPWLAINPRNTSNLIGVWQQDRWRFGGARGLVTGVSHDAGQTWSRTWPHFSRCAGGTAANKGNYERASDPWVSISPNGVAHQISLSFDFVDDANQAILVSRSTNEGHTWSEPTALIADVDPKVIDDKGSITADPQNSQLVYAVWDRLEFTDATQTVLRRGPTVLSRTTNGGNSWEPARAIYDPGVDAQTIANQIAVLPNGDLVNLLVRFLHANENSPAIDDVHLAVVRSHDKGHTWSAPTLINTLQSIGITDPKTGEPVRTGDIIPNIAVDRETGDLHVVWQDSRFSGRKRDGIVFSTSHDGGLTWSAPTQINKATNVQAFTASISVADESIAVTHYDLRHDNADPNLLLTDYWRLDSSNGGETWRESHIAGPFDMRTAPFANGFFTGDYEGLAHSDNAFVPFVVLANSGNLSNRTDVFVATAEGDDQPDGVNQQESNVPARSWRERVNSHSESRRSARDS